MVLAYWGMVYTEAEISKAMDARPYGTPSFFIQKLQSRELNVVYRAWSPREVVQSVTNSKPMIAFVRSGFLDYSTADFAHAIVVVGIEPQNWYWVNDPAQPTAPLKVSWDGMMAAWAEFDYRGAMLAPVSS